MKQSDINYEDYKKGELHLDFLHPHSQNKIFIFVEGEDDVRLFQKFFDLNKCKVEYIPGGKNKLESHVKDLLKERKNKLIVAIRDADFLRITNPNYQNENIILTDCHDIEMTSINQKEPFKSLLCEYAETLYAETLKESEFDMTKQTLLEIIRPISLLRLANSQEKIGLRFKNVKFQKLLDFDKKEVNITNYVQIVLKQSKNITLTYEELVQKIEDLENQDFDLYQLTNGHDMANVLSAFFNKKHKNGRKKDLSNSRIEKDLRLCFHIECFKKTQMYQELKKWETKNSTSIFKN